MRDVELSTHRQTDTAYNGTEGVRLAFTLMFPLVLFVRYWLNLLLGSVYIACFFLLSARLSVGLSLGRPVALSRFLPLPLPLSRSLSAALSHLWAESRLVHPAAATVNFVFFDGGEEGGGVLVVGVKKFRLFDWKRRTPKGMLFLDCNFQNSLPQNQTVSTKRNKNSYTRWVSICHVKSIQNTQKTGTTRRMRIIIFGELTNTPVEKTPVDATERHLPLVCPEKKNNSIQV